MRMEGIWSQDKSQLFLRCYLLLVVGFWLLWWIRNDFDQNLVLLNRCSSLYSSIIFASLFSKRWVTCESCKIWQRHWIILWIGSRSATSVSRWVVNQLASVMKMPRPSQSSRPTPTAWSKSDGLQLWPLLCTIFLRVRNLWNSLYFSSLWPKLNQT